MADIIIQGIPYDEKSSFLKGTALAPPLIREALHSIATNSFAENGVDISKSGIEDMGDFEIHDFFEIEKITARHLQQHQRILTLGGDHSITFPVVKALNFVYPAIDILHIDAHPDLYHEYEGDPYSHACPFARIMENNLVERLVQVGIRTLNTHQSEQAKKFGVEVNEMKNLESFKIPSFENPVYISIDIDGIDPAFAPGVSHQEAGGLSSRQVIDIIQGISSRIIGADIVEYNPNKDSRDITCALAAKLMKEILGKMIEID